MYFSALRHSVDHNWDNVALFFFLHLLLRLPQIFKIDQSCQFPRTRAVVLWLVNTQRGSIPKCNQVSINCFWVALCSVSHLVPESHFSVRNFFSQLCPKCINCMHGDFLFCFVVFFLMIELFLESLV